MECIKCRNCGENVYIQAKERRRYCSLACQEACQDIEPVAAPKKGRSKPNQPFRRKFTQKRYTDYPYDPGTYDPVDLEAYRVEENGCWRWIQRPPTTNGYHSVWLTQWREGTQVHRLFYLKHKGLVPPGSLVHHMCQNKWCVNPAHLVALTEAEHGQWHRDHAEKTIRQPPQSRESG